MVVFIWIPKKKNVGGVSRVHLGYRRRDVEVWLQKTGVDKFAWEAELTRRITAEYPKAKFTMGSMENENADRTYWFIRCGRDANEIDSVVRCNEIFDAVLTEYTTWYHPEVKPVN